MLSSGIATRAQFNLGFRESNSLQFIDGSALRMATVGGFSFPQFSEIYIDSDEDLDLFVFDRGNNVWRTFIYDAVNDRYDYAPQFEQYFPRELEEMVQLRDYNCDGYHDIITYKQGSFKVYKNLGTKPPTFEMVTDELKSTYGSIFTGIYLLPGDIPAIVDVDGDGDLDILNFGNANSENTIEYHQNQSIDNYGICDSLEFICVTQCWGNVEEPPNSSALVTTSCKGIIPPQGSRQHPGSTVLAIDFDNDDDKDLIVGDIQTDELLYAPNIGDASSASLDVANQSHDFPNSQDPAKMQYMISGFEFDHNHDGRQDLVLTINNRIDSSCNTHHTWLYEDNGSGAKSYSLVTKGFLQEEMVDLGSSSVPIFFDVDGDGLNDLLIACSFRRTPTNHMKSRLYFFKNTGSATVPQFELTDDDFANWSLYGFDDAYPALGDLDGDGDMDMLVGVAEGDLNYFRNDPSGGMASFSLTQANFMNINSIGANAAPEFADVDGDGDLDLLVGEKLGYIQYFENTGSTTAAMYNHLPTIQHFGGIDVSYYCCSGNATPKWIDNSSFGSSKYLFVGSSEKQVKIYQASSNLNDSFAEVDSILINAGRLAPIFEDLDADGIVELLIGTGEGGLKYFDRSSNYHVGFSDMSIIKEPLIKGVFPNPAGDHLNLELSRTLACKIEIFDMSGRLVYSEVPGTAENHLIEISNLNPGIYHLVCTANDESENASFVVLR